MPPSPRKSARTRRDARLNVIRQDNDINTDLAKEFDKELSKIKIIRCSTCAKGHPELRLINGICRNCSKRDGLFSAENDMDIGEVPLELMDLTMIEQILIARIHPVISLYKIRGSQLAYSGNVINFRKEVSSIASVLPHDLATLDTLMLVNKETPSGLQIFRARAGRVGRALRWLKMNHRYYADITIDESRLEALPQDGDLVPFLQDLGFDDAAEYLITEDLAARGIETSFCPAVPPINQQAAIDNEVNRAPIEVQFPQMSTEPINEFQTEGYISMAFPCLFPYGRGDLRYPLRPKKISFDKYFKYLLKYHDQRFCKDQRFPFFAMNSKMRWDALRIGSVYIRKDPRFDAMTIDEMVAQIEHSPQFADNIMYFAAGLRSTRQYWRQRCAELLEMVAQIGTPTVFFTLSAADYHWADIFKLINPNIEPENLTDKQRRDLMHENPHLTAYYFQKRAGIFITKIMRKFFKVKDYWYRFEWQWRGSPHVHGLLWLENAPNIDDVESLNEDQINSVINYFDTLCSAMNYNPQARSAINPCRRKYSQVPLERRDQDLQELLNNVQRHTKCGKTCLRKKRGSNRETCRFNFPQTLRDHSSIEKPNGAYEFLPKRNDERMQRYNSYVSQVWRANTDFTPIVSNESVLNYIAKYASKSEKSSESYQDLAKRIAANRNPDTTPQSIIKKIILSSVSERDYSAQEVAHILMGWPLFKSSRSIVSLIVRDEWRGIQNQGSSLISNYKLREEGLEHICLFKYVQKYYRQRGRTIQRQQDCVVRVIPKLKYRDDGDNEEYYHFRCKLYIPWRHDVDELKEHPTQTWEEIYLLWGNHHNDANDLELPPHEMLYENDEEFDVDEILERDVGMAAARICPLDTHDDELGRRGVDEAFAWSDIATSDYNKDDILEFGKKLKTHYRAQPTQVSASSNHIFRPSDSQKAVLDICFDQLRRVDYSTKRVLVQGKAGTGKSALIKEMCSLIQQNTPFASGCAYQVLAPTGAAAINVDGKTFHNFLRIPVSGFTELRGQSLRELQNKFKSIKFLIFDEYSMIGARMLHKINQRCMEVKNNSTEPFGGLFVWFFGDVRQLPPVKDVAIYSTARDEESAHGMLAFGSIQRYVFLNTSFRQGPEQQEFRNILDEVAKGTITMPNFEILLTRRAAVTRHENHLFASAIRLFPTNQLVNSWNKKVLGESQNPVAQILAVHNNRTAESCSDDQAQGLTPVLYLSVGCRVMLRKNLQVEAGLVNGALGNVKDIIFEEGRRPPSLPLAVIVEFDKYTGPPIAGRSVPILPVSASWKNGPVECSRRQLPLSLAYALTVHKSQGLTIDRAVVDIGISESSPGLTYVALSRVRTLQSLQLVDGYNQDRILSIGRMKQVLDRENFIISKFGCG